MITYVKNVSDPWFSLIAVGRKTVEGRLSKGDFARMQVGDQLILVNDQLGFERRVTTMITAIKHYANFVEYLATEGLTNCLPTIEKLEQGVAIYHSFPGFAEAEHQLGVIALHLSLV